MSRHATLGSPYAGQAKRRRDASFMVYVQKTADALAAELIEAEVAFTCTPRPWGEAGDQKNGWMFRVAPDKADALRDAVGRVVR